MRPDTRTAGQARNLIEDLFTFLLHFLGLGAGLIAPVNGSLMPTPRAADWIRQSPLEQTRWLVRALFDSPPGQTENWWRRPRMPGWRVLNDRTPPYRPIHFCDLAGALATDQVRAIRRDDLRTIFPAARQVNAPDSERQPDSLLDAHSNCQTEARFAFFRLCATMPESWQARLEASANSKRVA